jgi:tripartite-type tricarboxylate transporter receptor subunit TctC
VTHVLDSPILIVARMGFPASTLNEVIAMAKARPAQISYGGIAAGTKATYPVELLMSMTGISFNLIGYKGEQPMVTDMLGDRVDLGSVSLPSALPHIKAGKLKAIAAISPKRVASLPDVATVTESIPGYEAATFIGLFVPNGTPRAVIDKLNEIATAAIASTPVQERMREDSLFAGVGKPQVFADRLRADTERWNKLMK